jgi:hypothetical protein
VEALVSILQNEVEKLKENVKEKVNQEAGISAVEDSSKA